MFWNKKDEIDRLEDAVYEQKHEFEKRENAYKRRINDLELQLKEVIMKLPYSHNFKVGDIVHHKCIPNEPCVVTGVTVDSVRCKYKTRIGRFEEDWFNHNELH